MFYCILEGKEITANMAGEHDYKALCKPKKINILLCVALYQRNKATFKFSFCQCFLFITIKILSLKKLFFQVS